MLYAFGPSTNGNCAARAGRAGLLVSLQGRPCCNISLLDRSSPPPGDASLSLAFAATRRCQPLAGIRSHQALPISRCYSLPPGHCPALLQGAVDAELRGAAAPQTPRGQAQRQNYKASEKYYKQDAHIQPKRRAQEYEARPSMSLASFRSSS